MQELKCHGSPGKNSSFNLCWSQNTQLCRAGMLAHQGVLEHSPLQSTTTATLLESPLVFKSDSLWHFPSEREKAAEKQGNPFQHLSHCSLQKWGHRKKKNSGCGFSNLWGKSILQPQAPPQRFSLFLLCTGTNPGSRILFSGEEAGPASVRGTWAALRLTVLCWPITWKHPNAAASLRQQRKRLCSGILCGTTTEINSCNDTL